MNDIIMTKGSYLAGAPLGNFRLDLFTTAIFGKHVVFESSTRHYVAFAVAKVIKGVQGQRGYSNTLYLFAQCGGSFETVCAW